MEVKIFTKVLRPKVGFLPKSDTATDHGLEAEINLWLASQPNIDIQNITQSQSGGSFQPATLVVSVWYN
ncbi:conserved hypothetical protein [Shewanella sediminis HAW-EB3]|uniref:Uncharacterized protein n=1 Tax=Shewanella sediminis (strain HAW-EB3) TaxID=425104 RepID=A8FW92_SHESH|nr:hypothetical protein [Shewanella sediminis]ABV37115.1 conserved hypothetical protein [Shewanella sediminis HAW-EB3]